MHDKTQPQGHALNINFFFFFHYGKQNIKIQDLRPSTPSPPLILTGADAESCPLIG